MTLALALCAMTPDQPPETPPQEPWLSRIFPTVVRWTGLVVSVWLIVSGRVEPSIGLAFAGTMVSGTLLAEVFIGRKK